MKSELNLVTVVPPPCDAKNGMCMASGTKVLLRDGSELQGVTRVELVAEVGGLWRARIDCVATVPTMPGMLLEISEPRRLVWWQRLLLRMSGATGSNRRWGK